MAKIVRRLDQSAPEMILPDAIHNRAPGERMPYIGEPPGERGSPVALVVAGGQVETRTLCRRSVSAEYARGCQCAWNRFLAGLLHVSAIQHENRTRLAAGRTGANEVATPMMDCPDIHHALCRQFCEGLLRGCGLTLQCLKLRALFFRSYAVEQVGPFSAQRGHFGCVLAGLGRIPAI